MNTLALLLAAEKQQGSIFSLLVLILPLGALMYLMIVPQRKQRAKQAAFLSGLDVGDEVVTSGGVYGRITFLEDTVAHLEIDTDVVIRVAKSALTRTAAAEPATKGSAQDTDASADGETTTK